MPFSHYVLPDLDYKYNIYFVKYLKLFESFNTGDVEQLDNDQFKSWLQRQDTWSSSELDKIETIVKSKYTKNFEVRTEAYLKNNIIVISGFTYDSSKKTNLNLCLYKLSDEYFIASFDTLESTYRIDFLCDGYDTLIKFIKSSTDSGDIQIPFDYWILQSRSYPRIQTNDSNALNASNVIRYKVKNWGFNVEYDELLPRTTGSHSLKAWKAVEYSDLSEEAIKFYNVRREPGRRIVIVTFSLTAYTDTVLVHFGMGPELSRKHKTFECKINSVGRLLDDKFGLLG